MEGGGVDVEKGFQINSILINYSRLLHTLRVEWVSPRSAGVTVQIIQVLAFPPRDDCNILVNLDSLNGMWALYM